MALLGPETSYKMAAKMAAILDFTKGSNLSENAELQIHFARIHFDNSRKKNAISTFLL